MHIARVLIIGVNNMEHQAKMVALRDKLERICQGWIARLVVRPRFPADHLAYIDCSEHLELVHLANETKISYVDYAKGCEILADMLVEHPNRIGVNFENPNLGYLHTIFAQRRVSTSMGSIETAFHHRWETALETQPTPLRRLS